MKKIQENFVLVIGDIMLDRFSFGSVDRISPESPVPVLKIERETRMLGGAGNVISNLTSLGVPCDIVAAIGNDFTGELVKSELQKNNISGHALTALNDRQTITKTRFISGHQHMLRVDEEDITPLSEDAQKDLLVNIDRLLPQAGAVILSDYGKAVLSHKVLQHVIQKAKESGTPVIIDPKGQDYTKYKGATAITPNRKELAEATDGMPTKSDSDILAAANKLIADHDFEAVFATRSGDGISVITKTDAPVHIPTQPLEVFDVAGAGDTVIAVIAAAMAAGASLAEAASLANTAGSIVVTRVGTSAIEYEELEDAVRTQNIPGQLSHIAPVCDRDAARNIVEEWQNQGLTVGLTNGCFDILHYGHVTYLAEARKKCDKLIVALNTDDSVKALKGPLRPVNDENTRGQVMAALSSVDMVTFFGSDARDFDTTATSIAQTIKPDIYFKGGDYKLEDVPEAQAVIAEGGEAVIMSLYEGYSTTSALDRYVEGLENEASSKAEKKAS